MNERLKVLRNTLRLSQNEFSERILVGSSTLAMWEIGSRRIKDIHISKICSEFNVNENWLRYGLGEMFVSSSENIISELEKKYEMGDVFKKAVVTYLELNELSRAVIDDYLDKVFSELKNKNN